MSDRDCPDKLEPQYLTSVLKNVPVDIMWELRKYHSKPSHFEVKWKARQPTNGKKYGWGGNLKWEDAKSGDMYVRDRSLEQKYHHLQDAHCVLRSEYDNLITDHMDGEEWKVKHKESIESFSNLQVGHRLLQTKYDDLNDVHRSLSNKYNEVMQDRDDLFVKADDDYDAVTKGVISLINLLRR